MPAYCKSAAADSLTFQTNIPRFAMASRQELIEILEENIHDTDLMFTIIQEYVLNMNDEKLAELEDFLVNNFCDWFSHFSNKHSHPRKMSRTVYVEIAVQIDDNACPIETIEDCDYTLDGDGILSHEIIGVYDNDRSYF